jgi:hypothetical protein
VCRSSGKRGVRKEERGGEGQKRESKTMKQRAGISEIRWPLQEEGRNADEG